MKKLITIYSVATMFLLIVGIGQVNGDVLNYDPEAVAPAPVLDAGWTYDQIDASFVDTADSPYVFTLTTSAYFRITDDFVVGDIYYVYNFGNLILTTTPSYAGAPTGFGDPGESAWQSSAYSGGEILLAPGSYHLTVQGDGAGGVPAGLYTQLTTPEPATMCLLGLGVLMCRKFRKA